MAKAFVLSAECTVQGIRVTKKALNDFSKNLKIDNITAGAAAMKGLREKIIKTLGNITIHKISASNIAIANLKRQLQRALKDLGTFTFNAKVNTQGGQRNRQSSTGPQQQSTPSRSNLVQIVAKTVQVAGNNLVVSGGRGPLRISNRTDIGGFTGPTVRTRRIQPIAGLIGGPTIRTVNLGAGGGGRGGGGSPPGGGGGTGGPGGGGFSQLPRDPKTFRTFRREIQDATSDLQIFGRQAGNTLRRFFAYSVVSSIFIDIQSAVRGAISDFIEFDREIVRIAQITRGTNSELGAITTEVRNLATGLGVSSLELLKSAETLAQAGIAAKDLPTILNAVAKSDLAPTFGGIQETTEGLIAIFSQFNTKAEDTASILGSVNSVSARFAVESGDILTAVRRAGGAFAAANKDGKGTLQTFQEFIAAFTAIRATTRESAESIATGLRTIVTRIQRPRTISFLEQFGIDITDDQGNFAGIIPVLKELNKEFARLQETGNTTTTFSILEEIGGFRQVSKLLPLITEFTKTQDAFATSLLGIGSLSVDAVKAQDSLANRLTKVREEFNKTVADFAQSNGFKQVTDVVLTLTRNLVSLTSALSNIAPTLALIALPSAIRRLGTFGVGFGEGLLGRSDAFGRLLGRGSARRPLPSSSSVLERFNPNQLFSRGSRIGGAPVGVLATGFGLDRRSTRSEQVFQANLQEAARRSIEAERTQIAYNRALNSGAANAQRLGREAREAAQSLANFVPILEASQTRALASSGLGGGRLGNGIIGRTVRGTGRFFGRNRELLATLGLTATALAPSFIPDQDIRTTGGRATNIGVGALGGAGTGAAIGSIIPGLGTALGAAIGAVAGFAHTLHTQTTELANVKIQDSAIKFVETFDKLDKDLKNVSNANTRRSIILGGSASTADFIRKNAPANIFGNTDVTDPLFGFKAPFAGQIPTIETPAIKQNAGLLVDQLNKLLEKSIQTLSLDEGAILRGEKIGSTENIRQLTDLINTITFLSIPDGNVDELRKLKEQLTQNVGILTQFNEVSDITFKRFQAFAPLLESLNSVISNTASRISLASNITQRQGFDFGGVGSSTAFQTNALERILIGGSFNRPQGFDKFLAGLGNDTNTRNLTNSIQSIDQAKQKLFQTLTDLASSGFADIQEQIRGTGTIEIGGTNPFLEALSATIDEKFVGNVFGAGIKDGLTQLGDDLQIRIEDAFSGGNLQGFVESIFGFTENFDTQLENLVKARQDQINRVLQDEANAFRIQGAGVGFLRQAQVFGQSAIRARAGEAGLSLGQENELFRQRQLSLTGGPLNPVDIGKAALESANNVAELQKQLETLTDPTQISSTARALLEADQKTKNLTTALEAYADTSERSAAITNELNNLEKQKQGLLGLAERLFTGDPQEIRRLQAGFRLSTQVGNEGGLGNISGVLRNPEARKALIDSLRSFGDLQLPGRNISGNELASRVLLNFVGGPGTAQGLRNQQQGLLGQQANLQDQAQAAFIQLAGVNTKLAELAIEQSQRQQNDFDNALRNGINAGQVFVSGPISLDVSGNPFNQFATGGFVSGKTGKDKIPAMLSNGEFVMNANATKKFGPFLSAINSGKVGGFDNGGIISNIKNAFKKLPISFSLTSFPNGNNSENDILDKQIRASQRRIKEKLDRADKAIGDNIAKLLPNIPSLPQSRPSASLGPTFSFNSLDQQRIKQLQRLRGSKIFGLPRRRQNFDRTELSPNAVPFDLGNTLSPLAQPPITRSTPISRGFNFVTEFEGSVPFLGGNDARRKRLRGNIELNKILNGQQRANIDARRRGLTEIQITDPATGENRTVSRSELNRIISQERRGDRLARDLGRRGFNLDDEAVRAARSGASRADVLRNFAQRSTLGQTGASAIANGAVTTERISDQLGKVAQQLNDAASKIPSQIDIKVGDVNVNINGLDPLKIFNDKFLDGMATEVADRIRAQGAQQFNRVPN